MRRCKVCNVEKTLEDFYSNGTCKIHTCKECVCRKIRSKYVSKPRKKVDPWNKGIPISEEQKQKLNEGRDKYHKEVGAWNKGLKMTEEFRKLHCPGRPMPHSEETKRKMGDGRRVKGISRSCKKYKLWKEEVLKRDNYKCITCGSKESLTCHHVIPFYECIEKRFDVDNGQTLCAVCHGKIDGYTPGQEGTWKGKKLSEEHKKKLSRAKKGKPHWSKSIKNEF